MLFAIAPFADVITQEARDLGTMGGQALLGVAVLALTTALVVLFRLWRADMAEKRKEFVDQINLLAEKHEEAEQRWRDEMRQQRADFSAALKDVSDAVRQSATESRANAAAIIARLEHLERSAPRHTP